MIRTSLLDLMQLSGFDGTKKGCDHEHGSLHRVGGWRAHQFPGLALAVQVSGRITTVEGFALNGNLHPMQQAFIEHDGFFNAAIAHRASSVPPSGWRAEIERNIPSAVTSDLTVADTRSTIVRSASA